MAKNRQNWQKRVRKGPKKLIPNTQYLKQFLFYAPTKISLSKWANLIGQSQRNGQNGPKMVLNGQKWPFLGYAKSPKEARNTNTKFPDPKW